MNTRMRLMMGLGLVALLLVLALSAAGTVAAQNPSPVSDDQVLQVAKSLYCPVCTGVPLDVCDTQACVQWRALIREKLEAGQTEEQIRQYFIAQYGDRVLGAPPPEGFNLGAYVLPLLILLGGALAVFWSARSWLKRSTPAGSPDTPPVASPISAEYADRIARELKARE